MPDLFAALARKRLDREQLKDKVRLVLAEKENEVTKAWAEKENEVTKARAEKENEVTKAWAEKENEVTKARAEKENEVTKARAEKEIALAEKATAQVELKVTILQFQAKTMEALRLTNSVSLRGAIGKCRGWSIMCPWSCLSLTPLHTHIYRVFSKRQGVASSSPQAQDAVDGRNLGGFFA